MSTVQRKMAARTLGLVLLFACGSETLEPGLPEGPGFLAVRLTTPNTDDGGILFTLSGGPIDSVRVSLKQVLTGDAGANERRVIVAGALSNGTVASFWVPERRDVANYRAVLEQATVIATYEQQTITSYVLSVVVQ
ncbi:MAG: hypothetical protein O7I93_09040 [Gemmatimonadetes bacterium]|nr:hypothetical protein [Gemmatimonadota bacterium]